MNSIILAAAAAVAQPPADETIVVTASREPVPIGEVALSAMVIEEETLEALALPVATDVLRLVPGVSVSASGPKGTQTQVRIRGGETNHTLLFVDGIRFNDPAADNFARFELLTSDLLSRIEVVRGPQSALWGSEALGGVVAVETADPLRTSGFGALAEYGSLDSLRASAQFAQRFGEVGLSASAGWLKSDGIDSFGSGGELDGFENRAATAQAVYAAAPTLTLGLVGHWVEGESEFDGTDPTTFLRADTLDETDNRIGAVRGWGEVEIGDWSALVDASYLDSANRNRLGDEPLNSTFGERLGLGAQVSRSFGGHRVTAAVEREHENFRTARQIVFGAPDQDRSRKLTAVVGEWRAEWSDTFITDVAVRHDAFSAFEDATTLRASALFRPARGWSVHGSYGEGIAQPTFYDLFGFFPGSFVGNADLRPERSRGVEAGLRWSNDRAMAGATAFRQRLKDEITGTFDFATGLSGTVNAAGRSRRQGIEVEGRYDFGGFGLAANYTYLDATDRQVSGAAQVREIRRPKHSANLFADGSLGALKVGASLAYVGKRQDTDFDLFQTVKLDDYVLASLKLGYPITPAVEAYARIENAFDADYQDVVGYFTPGRTVYAGIRLRLGR